MLGGGDADGRANLERRRAEAKQGNLQAAK